MPDKKTLFVAGGLALAVLALIIWGIKDAKQGESPVETAPIVYFYGAECPHCKAISEFLDQNDVASKVSFVKKEVWHDRKNAREMQKRAEMCGIVKDAIGVPFVATAENKCFVGEPDVRQFFSEKAGLTESNAN